MKAGFILLYRQITEWEWYRNPNTFRVFLHCLLMANFTEGKFEGITVERGQFVTSLPTLSKQTRLTIQQVRTALDHLKSTGEITDRAYSKFRVITVCKYNEYQQDSRQDNSQSTGNQQASNRQSTGNQQQYNNNNNGIREQGNNHHLQEPPPFLSDDEAGQIQSDHNQILDAAQNAGFKSTPAERAGLLNLYAAHGLDKMIAGIGECVTHSAPNLAYLTAVLNGTGKKKAGNATDVHGYEQRDYSGEQAKAIERMMADGEW